MPFTPTHRLTFCTTEGATETADVALRAGTVGALDTLTRVAVDARGAESFQLVQPQGRAGFWLSLRGDVVDSSIAAVSL